MTLKVYEPPGGGVLYLLGFITTLNCYRQTKLF